MNKSAKKILKHPLIAGSLVIFFGSTFGNFLNFIFNIFISRNLTVQDYGTVASLMAIINLFGISAGAITPTIVSFTSESFLKNDLSYVKGVYLKILKPFALMAGIFLVLFFIFGDLISKFLNITNGTALLAITGIIIFIGFISVLNLSLFQSKLSFKLMSFLNLTSSTLKLSLGIAFVFSGLKAIGVMLAILAAYLAPYLLGFVFLRFLFVKRVERVEVDFKKLLRFALPSGLALLGLTAIISTDLVLVKHLFDTNSAGIYAGLALVGKVIFFFTAPIGVVMFPLMARRHTNQKGGGKLVPLSLILVALASFGITIFYFLFPDFVISLFLKNKEYLSASPYLGLYGVFISLYSLCSIMMYYFLSIKKTWIYKPILGVAFFQALGIYLLHNSFGTIISISIFSTFMLLTLFSVYYFKLIQKR